MKEIMEEITGRECELVKYYYLERRSQESTNGREQSRAIETNVLKVTKNLISM